MERALKTQKNTASDSKRHGVWALCTLFLFRILFYFILLANNIQKEFYDFCQRQKKKKSFSPRIREKWDDSTNFFFFYKKCVSFFSSIFDEIEKKCRIPWPTEWESAREIGCWRTASCCTSFNVWEEKNLNGNGHFKEPLFSLMLFLFCCCWWWIKKYNLNCLKVYIYSKKSLLLFIRFSFFCCFVEKVDV